MRKTVIMTLFIIIAGSMSFARQFTNPVFFDGHRTTVNQVLFSPDGRYLAAAGGNNEVILWDAATAQKISVPVRNPRNKPLTLIAFSFDGKLLAAAGFSGARVTVSGIPSGKVLYSLPVHAGEYAALAASPRENLFASAGQEPGGAMSIKLWDGKTVRTLYASAYKIDDEYISALAFSPDGTLLACGTSNRQHGIMVWNIKTGRMLYRTKHGADVSAIIFSPDGNLLAGGGTDNRVSLWNARTGALIRSFPPHRGYLLSVSFSPDGKYIASSGMDRRSLFKVWDARSGDLVQSEDGSSPDVRTVCFSPDGGSLAVGLTTYGDLFDVKTVRVYKTESAFRSTPWYSLSSPSEGFSLDFPRRPESRVNYKEDAYYAYSTYDLNEGQMIFNLRVVRYKYAVTADRRRQAVMKTARTLVDRHVSEGGTLVYSRPFRDSGAEGVDYLVEKKDRSGSMMRSRGRILFSGDKKYEIRFNGYGPASYGDRFVESFKLK